MGYFSGKLKPEQPGVNGVRYASKTKYLYYTATAKTFMRVKVDAQTFEPTGEHELVVPVPSSGQHGRLIDFMLLERRNICAANRFLKQSSGHHVGRPPT